MAVRYAVYFAPNPLVAESTSALLHDVMTPLFGRDGFGETVALTVPEGFTEEEWGAVVKTPAHYGLHATLKAPFELARAGVRPSLVRAVAEIASHFVPFDLPKMRLAWIAEHSVNQDTFHDEKGTEQSMERGFFALVPETPSSLLPFLERACVMDLDSFRAPISSEDIARRHVNTERERNHLVMWGYHRVLEDFRFHITLTGSIADEALRDRVQVALEQALVNVIGKPLAVDSIVLFRQERRTLPFTAVQRFPFSTIQQQEEENAH